MPDIFQYRDVIADLRSRGAKLFAIADDLQQFVIDEAPAAPQLQPPAEFRFAKPAPGKPQPETKASTVKPARRIKGLTLGDAILQALAEKPLAPPDLKKAVLAIRPDTAEDQIHKQSYVEKEKGKIFKGADGRWCLGQAPEIKARFDQATPQAPRPVSVSELIRQTAATGDRTLIQLADEIQRLRPDTVRGNVTTIIGQQLREGKLRREGQDATGSPFIRTVATNGNGAHA